MEEGRVELSVIVVAWNSGVALGRCLASVEGASKGMRTETVVVDNASTDGSAAPAAERDGVRLIRNSENVGFAGAVNQALSEAELLVRIASMLQWGCPAWKVMKTS